MRGRAFLGAFIALCLIAGCSSSSANDEALEEALDRIESLEAQPSENESTATTAPDVNLINLVRDLHTQRRESIHPDAWALLDEDTTEREMWDERFLFTGGAKSVQTTICHEIPYIDWGFQVYTLLFEKLGFSNGLATRIFSTRSRENEGQYFEDHQNGFHIEWMSDNFCQPGRTGWAIRVWVTYEG